MPFGRGICLIGGIYAAHMYSIDLMRETAPVEWN